MQRNLPNAEEQEKRSREVNMEDKTRAPPSADFLMQLYNQYQ